MQPERLNDLLRSMALELPDQAAFVLHQMEAEGLAHPTVTEMTQQLQKRAVACQKLLAKAA
jgi:hypothetical protein